MGRFPAFGAFLRAYLHEDFASEHGSPDAALASFLGAASADERKALGAECRELAVIVEGLPLSAVRRLFTDELRGAWWPARKREVVRLLKAAARIEGGSDA